jgi:hypothetical protein
MPDADSLPPTAALMLDVLGSRERLGQSNWTFESRLTQAANILADRGLANWKSATIPHHILVWLTAKGRKAVLSDTWQNPVDRERERIREAATLYAHIGGEGEFSRGVRWAASRILDGMDPDVAEKLRAQLSEEAVHG